MSVFRSLPSKLAISMWGIEAGPNSSTAEALPWYKMTKWSPAAKTSLLMPSIGNQDVQLSLSWVQFGRLQR